MHHAEVEGLVTERDLRKVEAARQQAIERSSRYLPLRTARLELRPSQPDYLDETWAAIRVSIAELQPWMPWAISPRKEDTRGFLEQSAAEWESGSDRHFSVFMDGSYCGNCSLIRVDRAHRSAELGYWMRSDLCGKGLTTEAAHAVVSFGFWQEGMHRVELQAGVANVGSLRVAEKLGFHREGCRRHSGRGSNGFYDAYAYGLLSSDPRPDLDVAVHD
jgi:RimJ/RimL family protein N-acetyltransferase